VFGFGVFYLKTAKKGWHEKGFNALDNVITFLDKNTIDLFACKINLFLATNWAVQKAP